MVVGLRMSGARNATGVGSRSGGGLEGRPAGAIFSCEGQGNARERARAPRAG